MNIKEKIKRINFKKIIPMTLIVMFITLLFAGIIYYVFEQNKNLNYLKASLTQKEQELTDIVSEDPYKINKVLQEEIKNIHDYYSKTVTTYEELIYFKENTKKLSDLDSLFAQVLDYLSQKNYSSASATLDTLSQKIKDEQTKTSTAFIIPENTNSSNNPPSSGYSRQTVQTDIGSFMVSIITADISSTKIIVDTASDSDCSNDCPVLSLSSYISRNGAFAGVNGSYFCPATYPTCAGKTNSFDTLLMNKNKTYFNSDNNVYSINPVAIFSNSSRFVENGSSWGRDTSVDAVIMGRPLLVFNGEVKFFGNSDTKETSRGNRSFLGASDGTVYIGIVYSATVAETAKVLAKLGIKNAINLDSGGSSAFWSNGRYLAGPGRDLPFGILLVKR